MKVSEKTERNPRGAGRKPKPKEERAVSLSITARRPVVEAITELARRQGLTRGQYIRRLLEDETRKRADEGKIGRSLGELYAVALAIARAARGDVARLEKLREAAIGRPAAIFPEILTFCSRELPRVTIANGRDAFKSRVADLTVDLGFAFPESLTDAEERAFAAACENAVDVAENKKKREF